MEISDALQRFDPLKALVQSDQVSVSVTPDFSVMAVQQNLTQTRFFHWKLGCAYWFLWERGREDDTFVIYIDNKKDHYLCKFRSEVTALLF